MHPAGADAAVHAGAALRKQEDKGMMASAAIGLYGAQEAFKGKHRHLESAGCAYPRCSAVC